MTQADNFDSTHIPKIYVICDRRDTAPVWGYILKQQGLVVILETSTVKASEGWADESPDLLVIDVDMPHEKRVALVSKIREASVIPILFILPAYHETQILEAYSAGVDEVVVKPVSPPIFLAKIMAWVRRSWTVAVEGLDLVHAGRFQLDPSRRFLVGEDGKEISLTNLEFRLLHLLMSRPAHVFSTDEIIHTIWGVYGNGDQILLKNVVYRLRKKIEEDPGKPSFLLTGQGGYLIQG